MDYFISLQESQSADINEQSVEMWNRRAEFWENARKKNQKGDERIVSAVNYLKQKGLLDKNYDVADSRNLTIGGRKAVYCRYNEVVGSRYSKEYKVNYSFRFPR